MSKAEQLAAEMQRYGITTMNRWATDGAALLRQQDALLRQALVAMELFVDEPHYRIEQAVKAIEEHLK